MVADKFEGKLGYVNKRNPFGGPPPLEGRSHLHRGIFDSSLARSVITPRITTRENFSSTSGGSTEWCMVAAEKSEAAEQTRKGAGAGVGSRERPSTARCREICRDLHGRLASLAPRERTSESPSSPSSFPGIIPWSTEFPSLRLP